MSDLSVEPSHEYASAPHQPGVHYGGMPIRTAPFQVIAVEDDAHYRASLEALLAHSPEFELAHSFASPDEALRAAEAAQRRQSTPPWDVILMDLGLPGLSGIECTRRMKALLPQVRIIALTVFEERATIIEAICAGADGYLLKRTPADRILAQLRTVVAGGSPLSAAVARTVLDIIRLSETGRLKAPARTTDGASSSLDLTQRERDVLGCLVDGRSYKGCARDLGISIETVRSHIRSVYSKLQVHNVAEAVGRALREGLV